jgi:hypothetical protein
MGSAERRAIPGACAILRGYPQDRLATFDDQGGLGRRSMQRARLVCAVLAIGIFASPAAAQQSIPDQTAPPPQQTVPEPPPPPPPEGSLEPAPPPLPPFPSVRHRRVDIGEHRTPHGRHHARRASHRLERAHHGTSHATHRTAHPTKRTLRWCRSMSHRQMIRHSECRALTTKHRKPTGHRHHAGSDRHHAVHHTSRIQRHMVRHSHRARHRSRSSR